MHGGEGMFGDSGLCFAGVSANLEHAVGMAVRHLTARGNNGYKYSLKANF
jgi:hypothetical protein